MDIGSRRLVARNRYRNTLNTFTGVDTIISQPNYWQWRNFVVLPVFRLPNDQASLRAGRAEFDKESFKRIFAGSFFSIGNLPLNTTGELYLFYLNEDDTEDTPTKNRKLFTPGFRWVKAAQPRHFALGYTFDVPWQPQLLLQYDYASGDKDPNDSHNNRYETLYGARRFEFGPTGIWGAFTRANINTPGIRLRFKPSENITGFIAHRAYWLAESKDAWVGSRGLRDTTGLSGSYIGQQMELRLRWKIIPKMITLEGGWAHLFKSSFAKNAPRSPTNKNDSDYFYSQISGYALKTGHRRLG